MKVALINFNQPVIYHKHSVRLYKRVWQPITLGILASMLRQKGDTPVIFDANAMNWSNETLVGKVVSAHPDVLVLNTNPHDRWQNPIPDIDHVLDFGRLLSEHGPPYPFLVIIGPHGTLLPDDMLSRLSIPNLIIRGEPEAVFNSVIEGIKSNKWKDIPSVSFREGNRNYHNNGIFFVENLDELPMPAYDLLPMDLYCLRVGIREYNEGHRFTLMTTSRGCPYACMFCNLSMYGRNYRKYSLERILKEIDLLVKNYGVNSIMFHDLTFVVDRKRTVDFCKALIERDYPLSWICQTRTQNTDLELLKLMKKAGCDFIEVGIETGHKGQHEKVKRIAFTETEEFIGNCRAARLGIGSGHLLGLPGANEETVKESARFLKSKGLPFRLTHTVIPYPGTGLFEQGIKEGKIKTIDWESVRMAAGKIGNQFTDEDLERLFQKVNRKYKYYLITHGPFTMLRSRDFYRLLLFFFRDARRRHMNIIKAFLEALIRTSRRVEWFLYKVY
jgi:radical SAM superfamily enzyme YgiQ (UPF0313 family)